MPVRLKRVPKPGKNDTMVHVSEQESPWRNPFIAGTCLTNWQKSFIAIQLGKVREGITAILKSGALDDPMTIDDTLTYYRMWILWRLSEKQLDLKEIRGKDLVCTCRENEKCHANVLLELANKKQNTPTKTETNND